MKTRLTLAVFCLLIAGQAAAQSKRQSELQEWKDSIASWRSATDREQQQADSLDYLKARHALLDLNFVLEGSRLTLKRGETGYVNSTTNFISLHKGEATIQISPFWSGGGPNGVGGVTVEGTALISNIETDKKGNTHLSMSVSGRGVSAQVTVVLRPGSNKASARVSPNFNSLNLTLDGCMMPFSESSVYKGSTF